MTTLQFTVLKLPFEVVMTLILAFFLSKKLKGAPFIRGVYFMPTVISAVLCSVIFTNLFQYFGYFNDLFLKLGIISEPIDWYANKWSAMTVLVASSVWKNFGTNVLLFTAALTNVPDELYEAADIDGAGPFKKFINITVPMIAPVFQTILLLAINGTLHVGEFIVTMTNGAPGGATHTVGSYILVNYVPGFSSGTVDIGYGAAISIITSIIYGLVAFGYNKISARLQNVY
ncbi:MAG: sugar ABC transporter permease [Clostridia bacterium]|nr:sugar ABC transporter permease [Clostridia bacterium]